MVTTTSIKESMPEKLPFLEAICWQTPNVYRFDPEQMLSRYERGWRYRNLFDNLEGQELVFLRQLAKHYDSWLQFDL
ncbi:hypothetical protein Xen7305DRAFT_00029330 [Xenococcus sp. PCC 7305]|uniref:hypothetical protein n=1 Tax=Xenococcus sp. PCC 7305 TaxID=102125 RepID=UPI0002ABF20A|nr:hypothetical protein [Xenococcus sp. PCC 7305]ELS03213.1 hypothetical protein Xen7305DRAFT_00029330 [Xenococcus sp. PCC 7305]